MMKISPKVMSLMLMLIGLSSQLPAANAYETKQLFNRSVFTLQYQGKAELSIKTITPTFPYSNIDMTYTDKNIQLYLPIIADTASSYGVILNISFTSNVCSDRKPRETSVPVTLHATADYRGKITEYDFGVQQQIGWLSFSCSSQERILLPITMHKTSEDTYDLQVR